MKLVIAIPARAGFSAWRWPDWATPQLRQRFPEVEIAEHRDGDADTVFDDAEAIVAWRLRAEWLARAPRLGWVHSPPAAVSGLLIPELAASGAVLTNGAAVHGSTVAEHALALMLALTRGLPQAVRQQRLRRWDEEALWDAGLGDLRGATALLLGLGHIGGALAVRLRAMEMRVLGWRRHAGGAVAGCDELHPAEALEKLLPRADYLVLALPVTTETRAVMNAARFARLRAGARLINVGRGALVDEAALLDALGSGRLAGAGLDVTAEEPLPAASPLWDHPRVLLTPHTAAMTAASWPRAIAYIEENLRRFGARLPLAGVVNQRLGY